MEMNPNGTGPTGGSRSTGGATDTGRGHPLPCGRTVEQVWQDMETGAATGGVDGHPADCPHCATARASLEQLADATRLLVEDPVEPPTGLLDKVMAAVRADLMHGGTIPLPTPSGAVVDISTHALSAVLRYAVDTVAGVRAHRCRIVVDPETPHTVRVWMSVSLHYGSGHVAALELARRRVAAALTDRIGLSLSGLDFEVADVWTDVIDNTPSTGGATGVEGPA
jgi:hypothetical protein